MAWSQFRASELKSGVVDDDELRAVVLPQTLSS
jgi:hypothetical protein